jgi:hypothetical protein
MCSTFICAADLDMNEEISSKFILQRKVVRENIDINMRLETNTTLSFVLNRKTIKNEDYRQILLLRVKQNQGVLIFFIHNNL